MTVTMLRLLWKLPEHPEFRPENHSHPSHSPQSPILRNIRLPRPLRQRPIQLQGNHMMSDSKTTDLIKSNSSSRILLRMNRRLLHPQPQPLRFPIRMIRTVGVNVNPCPPISPRFPTGFTLRKLRGSDRINKFITLTHPSRDHIRLTRILPADLGFSIISVVNHSKTSARNQATNRAERKNMSDLKSVFVASSAPEQLKGDQLLVLDPVRLYLPLLHRLPPFRLRIDVLQPHLLQ